MQRERRVTTAVVELDALADAVRAGAENHDLLFISRLGFVFLFVSRVKIGRIGFELGAAGVDAFIDGNQAEGLAIGAHFVFSAAGQISQAAVGKRRFFEGA